MIGRISAAGQSATTAAGPTAVARRPLHCTATGIATAMVVAVVIGTLAAGWATAAAPGTRSRPRRPTSTVRPRRAATTAAAAVQPQVTTIHGGVEAVAAAVVAAVAAMGMVAGVTA